ncbi:MAG: hypothetical protein HRU75_12625 [Planctomycetia bacterium]|nr:MAG: hypothetical protein HRU75_12625 [Planctomycetia bacterium]
MAMEAGILACSGCGATVYREHIEEGIAVRLAGKLYCSHCRPDADGGDGASPGDSAVGKVVGGPKTSFRRAMATNVGFATRAKTFHCKLATGPMEHLDDQINEWADANPDVQIKFATSVVGVVEGKHNDLHLIVTLFY